MTNETIEFIEWLTGLLPSEIEEKYTIWLNFEEYTNESI